MMVEMIRKGFSSCMDGVEGTFVGFGLVSCLFNELVSPSSAESGFA